MKTIKLFALSFLLFGSLSARVHACSISLSGGTDVGIVPGSAFLVGTALSASASDCSTAGSLKWSFDGQVVGAGGSVGFTLPSTPGSKFLSFYSVNEQTGEVTNLASRQIDFDRRISDFSASASCTIESGFENSFRVNVNLAVTNPDSAEGTTLRVFAPIKDYYVQDSLTDSYSYFVPGGDYSPAVTVQSPFGAGILQILHFICDGPPTLSSPVVTANPVVGQEVVISAIASMAGVTEPSGGSISISGPGVSNASETHFVSGGFPHMYDIWRSFVPTEPGEYTAIVSAQAAGVSSKQVTFTVGGSAAIYDFRLNQLQLAQVIFHEESPALLVRQKPLAIKAQISRVGTLPSQVERTVPVKAVITFQDGSSKTLWSEFSTNKLKVNESFEFYLPIDPGFDNLPGGQLRLEINSTADPGSHPYLQENNRQDNLASTSFSILDTNNVRLKFYLVKPPKCGSQMDCYDAPNSDQSSMISQSVQYLKGVFPVKDVGVDPEIRSISGVVYTSPESVEDDAAQLDEFNFINAVSGVATDDRHVGLVSSSVQNPRGYFSYHGYGGENPVYGIQFWGTFSRAALVEEGLPVEVAHEVTHTFFKTIPIFGGVPFPGEGHSSATEAPGFWGEKGASGLRNANSVPYFSGDLLSETNTSDLEACWADAPTYLKLIQTLKRNTKDERIVENAPVLYMNGFLSSDGTFTPRSTFGGVASRMRLPNSGSGRVVFLDPNGVKLEEASFNSEMYFEVLTHAGARQFPASRIPISFVAPIPLATAKLQIQVSGITTAEVDPNSNLLTSAIRAVPDRGFTGMVVSQRESLIASSAAISSYLSKKYYLAAKTEVEEILKPMVDAFLTDSFTKESSLEFNRTDVLNVLNVLISRNDALKSIVPNPASGILRLTTDKDEYVAGERAFVEFNFISNPSNPELEYFAELFLNGEKQKIELSDGVSWKTHTKRMAAGANSIVARTYLQNKRNAKSLTAALQRYMDEDVRLKRQLSEETDPEKMQQIQHEIDSINSKIEATGNRLKSERHPVGGDVEVKVPVR